MPVRIIVELSSLLSWKDADVSEVKRFQQSIFSILRFWSSLCVMWFHKSIYVLHQKKYTNVHGCLYTWVYKTVWQDIQHLRKVLLLSGRFTADSSFSSSGFAHFQKFTYFTCIVNVLTYRGQNKKWPKSWFLLYLKNSRPLGGWAPVPSQFP